jgi:hypothetical protein
MATAHLLISRHVLGTSLPPCNRLSIKKNGNGNGYGNAYSNDDDTRLCWKCNKPGHVKRDCPKNQSFVL